MIYNTLKILHTKENGKKKVTAFRSLQSEENVFKITVYEFAIQPSYLSGMEL